MTKMIVPIPPSYDADERLDLKQTENYINFLAKNEVDMIMTTAGTSQFNLLNLSEINKLNSCICNFARKKILGMPPLSNIHAKQFIESYHDEDSLFFMGLYPDRFYDQESILDYFRRIRECTSNPIYLHSMFMRAARGGQWNYTSDVISTLFEEDVICGIKEEYSDLQQAYNFVLDIPKELDIIVAGGSMRRHQFLKNSGATSFLSGIGNLFPKIEKEYCRKIESNEPVSNEIQKENIMFSTFNKYGWHYSLRIALSELGLCCFYDRMPWKKRYKNVITDITQTLERINNE